MLTNSRTHLFLLIAIALLGLTGCHSNQAIVHGLDERDANEILRAFGRKQHSCP